MTAEHEVVVTRDQWRRLTLPRRFQNMPLPDVVEIADRESGEMMPTIRIRTTGFDGKEKDFMWEDNCSRINLSALYTPDMLAHIMVQVKLRDDNDGTWGPAVDIGKSNLAQGEVKLDIRSGHYGFYVEAGKHSFITFREVAISPVAPKELRKLHPRYDELFTTAKASVVKILLRR